MMKNWYIEGIQLLWRTAGGRQAMKLPVRTGASPWLVSWGKTHPPCNFTVNDHTVNLIFNCSSSNLKQYPNLEKDRHIHMSVHTCTCMNRWHLFPWVPSPIHAWVMSDPVLYRPNAGNHNFCEPSLPVFRHLNLLCPPFFNVSWALAEWSRCLV